MTASARQPLKFGRDHVESEQVGTLDVQTTEDGSIAITVTFSPGELERELIAGGILTEAEGIDRLNEPANKPPIHRMLQKIRENRRVS